MAEPLLAGALQAMSRAVLSAVRVGAAGATGAPAVTLAEADHAPVPWPFVARTCTSYAVPFVSVVMVAVVAVPVCAWLVHVLAALALYCTS